MENNVLTSLSACFCDAGETFLLTQVHSVLVDRSHTPQWAHDSIEAVTSDEVESYFREPEGGGKFELQLPTERGDSVAFPPNNQVLSYLYLSCVIFAWCYIRIPFMPLLAASLVLLTSQIAKICSLRS